MFNTRTNQKPGGGSRTVCFWLSWDAVSVADDQGRAVVVVIDSAIPASDLPRRHPFCCVSDLLGGGGNRSVVSFKEDAALPTGRIFLLPLYGRMGAADQVRSALCSLTFAV